ncbi:MAG: hypothetical protein ACRDJF_04620 [Actinomycetota bacterium]
MNDDPWIYLVITGVAVFLIEFKSNPILVIASIFLLIATPVDVLKEALRDLWQFSTASRPFSLLIIVVFVFWIGREWAERHRAQYDGEQAKNKAWLDRSKYRGRLRE